MIYDKFNSRSINVKIILQPVTLNLDERTLHGLAETISDEFRHIRVTVAPSIALEKAQFQLAFDKERISGIHSSY